MKAIDGAQLIDNLNWRYATKKFDASKKIPADHWAKLEQAMVLSPSSFGLQPYRFVVITDAALRAKLREHAWNQSQVTDASHLVVLCRRLATTVADVDEFIGRSAKVRGVPTESLKGYRDMMAGFVSNPSFDFSAWAAKQVYIALGFLLSTAAQMGIDACPMEGFDPAKFDEILGLKAEGFGSTVIATVGYRAADDHYAPLKKVRWTVDQAVRRR